MQNSESSHSRGNPPIPSENFGQSQTRSQTAVWNALTDEVICKLVNVDCLEDIWTVIANMLIVIMRSLCANGLDTDGIIPYYTPQHIQERFAYLQASNVNVTQNSSRLGGDSALDDYSLSCLVNDVDWRSYLNDPNIPGGVQRPLIEARELHQILLNAGIGRPAQVITDTVNIFLQDPSIEKLDENMMDNDIGGKESVEKPSPKKYTLDSKEVEIAAKSPELLPSAPWQQDREAERQAQEANRAQYEEVEWVEYYRQLSKHHGWGNEYWPALHQAWEREQGVMGASPPDNQLSGAEISGNLRGHVNRSLLD